MYNDELIATVSWGYEITLNFKKSEFNRLSITDSLAQLAILMFI